MIERGKGVEDVEQNKKRKKQKENNLFEVPFFSHGAQHVRLEAYCHMAGLEKGILRVVCCARPGQACPESCCNI